MPDIPVIEACGVSKWYGETTALDRVDLRVQAGEVHGLVGLNGAGKTTLMCILFGLVRPDEGEIKLFGRTRETAGRGWLDDVAGFVEAPRFYPYLTGRRNLQAIAALDDSDASDLIDDALDLVGLHTDRDRKVKGYSLGMRQRLGLAAAILRRPRLVIVDEPGNGMDPLGQSDLGQAIRRLAAQGLTVLFSSHDMAQVDHLCDVVTVLDRGTVVFADTMASLRELAPDPQWRLGTSDDAGATEIARLFPCVEAADHPVSGLAVRAGQAELDRYVIALGREGIAIRRLDQTATAVESVLRRMVGEPDQDQAVTRERLKPAAYVGGRST